MSTSAAKDPAIVVDNLELTECLNGDCIIQDNEWRQGIRVNGSYGYVNLHIPKAHRNAIAEFLKV